MFFSGRPRLLDASDALPGAHATQQEALVPGDRTSPRTWRLDRCTASDPVDGEEERAPSGQVDLVVSCKDPL